jgi:hypothetical protein
MSELAAALAGGSVGAVLAAAFAQAGRARAAWAEVTLHDDAAGERNAQLLVWADDRTRELVREMQRRSEDFNQRGLLYSGIHGASLADAKADALHEYRDQLWDARIELARLRSREGVWHRMWRKLRRRPLPAVSDDTTRDVEQFLQRWREPVNRHHGDATGPGMAPIDRTTRTTQDALDDLHMMKLT